MKIIMQRILTFPITAAALAMVALMAFAVLSGCATTAPDPNAPQLSPEQQQAANVQRALDSTRLGIQAVELVVLIKGDEWSAEKVERWNLAIASARDALVVAEAALENGDVLSAEVQQVAIDALIKDLKRRAESGQEAPPPAEE